ncbi:MAG: hydrogenase [Lentisphaeria bacterium]|nr:hydrogenase [Lentisphaeria bacterium]
MNSNFLFLKNGTAAPWSDVPEMEFNYFRTEILKKMGSCRVLAFFALPETDGTFLLTAVLGDPQAQGFLLAKSRVSGKFASLTAEHAAFNRFEREIYEEHGLLPEGHPWLKPLRFQNVDPGVTDYFAMLGEAVHEVAVGPVHAGVIEPGHFRFECMGEDVYSLEISLGYQHRGVEKLLRNGPDARTPHLIETAAGDSSIAAAVNYARIVEALGNIPVSPEIRTIRQLALELERCANHIGDLGALAGDVAFLPTASFCGRIRGEYLNMSAELCGNRFGRNFVTPGGLTCAVDQELADKLLAWLNRVAPELWNALDLMFDSPTVLDRFENTGTVSAATLRELGAVGMAARAGGVACDSRKDFPMADGLCAEPVEFSGSGDVASRARIRYEELKKSHEFLFKVLKNMPLSPAVLPELSLLAPGMIAVSVTEAWRGELCHVALTAVNGKFRSYKIIDPSFHNWEALAMALRDEQISNFPICNKSFNLSYCGHDL